MATDLAGVKKGADGGGGVDSGRGEEEHVEQEWGTEEEGNNSGRTLTRGRNLSGRDETSIVEAHVNERSNGR